MLEAIEARDIALLKPEAFEEPPLRALEAEVVRAMDQVKTHGGMIAAAVRPPFTAPPPGPLRFADSRRGCQRRAPTRGAATGGWSAAPTPPHPSPGPSPFPSQTREG